MSSLQDGTALDEPPGALAGGPGAYSFFLDVDGTLADIAQTPDDARVDPAMLRLVPRLQSACGGAVALVSGRALASVDRMFAPLVLPAAGQHGCERRDATGVLHGHSGDPAELDALRRCIAGWADRVSGLVVEDKGMSIAVHYRRAPHLAALVRDRLEACLQRGRAWGFQAQPGRMVVEVRPAAQDKGRAILAFQREPPFAGRNPIFLGDDITDEFGFAVVEQLGGLAVKVGEGHTLARWRLADVAAVGRWLGRIIEGGDA